MTVSINSDKTISIDGRRVFPVGIYGVCSIFYEKKVREGRVAGCDPSRNSEFTFAAGNEVGDYGMDDPYWQGYIDKMEMNGIYWITHAGRSLPEKWMSSKYFFGYYQKDEPKTGSEEIPQYTNRADCEGSSGYFKHVWINGKCYYDDDRPALASAYRRTKSTDSDHPVILNLWEKLDVWANGEYADIITWDTYTIATIQHWPREHSIYAYEQWSEQSFFRGTDINSVKQPIWAVIQANGIDQKVGNKTLHPPTPAEARCNTYTAITMDVKGIVYYGYLIWSGYPANPGGNYGLYSNPALHAYYRQLAKELRSISNILLMPTVDYRWEFHAGTEVSFSKTMTVHVLWKDRTNFNYMLKRSGDATYLIVVNKDSRAIYDVEIAVEGITGQMDITTLGLETSGSGRAGRTLNGVDGRFTDSFDGYAVHIYRIVETHKDVITSVRVNIASVPEGASINVDGTKYT